MYHIERCLDYMNTKLTINLISLVPKWFSVHKVRRTCWPCTYYPNFYATCQLLLCGGDIAVNPGLCTTVKVKCQHCKKTIMRNQSKAMCKVCFGQYHAKCTDLRMQKSVNIVSWIYIFFIL